MSMRVLNLILAGVLLGLGGCGGGAPDGGTLPSNPSTNAGANGGATRQSGNNTTKGCDGCAKKDGVTSGSS